MRVIAGSARRLKLVTPEGLKTRPTSDKIKETLFNILQPEIYGSRFLDLFSGSGGIAIEALSRGASAAVLVENDREALRCIKQNITHTKFDDKAEVIGKDVFRAIESMRLGNYPPFDLVFMDPPYKAGLEEKVLSALKSAGLLAEDVTIIVEAAEETDFEFAEYIGFDVYKEKFYKNSKHVFMTLK